MRTDYELGKHVGPNESSIKLQANPEASME